MSAGTKAKADRLVASGAVHPIDDQPRGFMVDGDSGTYRVVVGRHMCWCDCPAGRRYAECAHQLAALKLFEAEHGTRL